MVFTTAPKVPYLWATYVIKFVATKLQKLPNLVTLLFHDFSLENLKVRVEVEMWTERSSGEDEAEIKSEMDSETLFGESKNDWSAD